MLILGIDTGGTYTDGVIIDKNDNAILAKVKVPTIKENIIESIESCISSFESKFDLAKVELVSLSTTLATNAIVEGKNLNAGLIGDVPDEKLPTDDYIYVNGKFNIKGESITPLNEASLIKELNKIKGKYEAIAISGYASVRNPIHEQRAKEITKEILGIPVVCGHELTGALGFQERTVTALLNAGIIHLIQVLIDAVESTMAKYKIKTPLMIVKGDGTLMEANYAKERPIETILSGPAASIMGAVFLSDINDGMIVDIGGTTTDIALLKNNDVKRDPHGASVGGWQTHVESLDINTYALGGDSAIKLNNALAGVSIGPNKIKPYSRISTKDAVNTETGLTPTDLLHLLKVYDFGDRQQVVDAIMKEFQLKIDEEMALSEDLLNEVIKKLEIIIMDSLVEFGVDKETKILGVGAPAHVWVNEVGRQRLKLT